MTEEHYLQKIIENPKDIWANTALGNIYFIEKDYPKAVEYFENVMDLDTWNEYANEKLGESYEKVIGYYLEYLKDNTDDADAYFKLAVAYGSMDYEDEAITTYKKVIELRPKEVTSYLRIGEQYAFFTRKEYKKALEYYEKAKAIDPTYVQTYIHISEVYLSQKQNDKAIEVFKKSIEIDSTFGNGYSTIGQTYFIYIKDYEKAIPYFLKGIEFNQTKMSEEYLYYDLGRSYYTLGKYELAVPHLLKALEINPKHSWSFLNNYSLGYSYKKLQQFIHAIFYLENAQEINPEDKDVYTELGYTYNELGELDESVRNYLLAIEKNPENDLAYHNIGEVFLKKGLFDKGLEYLLKGKEVNSRYHKNFFINIGAAYLLNGDDRAKEWFTKSKALYNNDKRFFKTMNDDYHALKMEERGISKKQFSQLIEALKK